MPPVASSPSRLLLASLLAVVAASGCGGDRKTVRRTYRPGGRVANGMMASTETSPAGVCARADDALLLRYIDTLCLDDPHIVSGPTEGTAADGSLTCTYQVAYTESDEPCAVPGRPLRTAMAVVIAAPIVDASWIG